MSEPAKKTPKLVEWVAAGTAVLRATKRKKLVALAGMLDAWAVKVSRRPLVVFTVALLAFIAVAKPVYAAIADAVVFVANYWSVCHELDPSTPEFEGRKGKRQCAPGQATVFTWREKKDTSACSDCNNRALQLTSVSAGSKQSWTEYYLVRGSTVATAQWRPAHTWSLSYERLNRGDGSYDEGFVVLRDDHGTPVCSQTGKPLSLQFFVSWDAGLGCGVPASRAGLFAEARKRLESARGHSCEPAKNLLHYRWIPSGSVDTKGPCSPDQSDPYSTRPDPVSPIKWQQGPPIAVLQRD